MDFKQIGSYIAGFAPALGSVLGGPLGGLAGEAVSRLFGADPKNPDDVYNKMTMDPDHRIKLIQLQNDYQLQLQKISETKFEAELSDTQDARKLEELSEESSSVWVKDSIAIAPFLITMGTISGLIFLSVAMLLWDQTQADTDIVKAAIAALGVAMGAELKYWFGASLGDK